MIYAQVIAILLGSFWLPWWWLTIVGVISGFLSAPFKSLLELLGASFISGFMVWGIFAYYFDARAYGLVSQRLAGMLGLPSPWFVLLITATLGGTILVGASGLGYSARSLFKSKASPR